MMRRTLSVRRRRNKERDEYETESYRFDWIPVCPHRRGQRASNTRRFASAGQVSRHRYVPAVGWGCAGEHWAKSRPTFLPSHYFALGPPVATARRSSLLRAADTWDWPRITKVGRSPTGSLHAASRPSRSNTGWDKNTCIRVRSPMRSARSDWCARCASVSGLGLGDKESASLQRGLRHAHSSSPARKLCPQASLSTPTRPLGL